MLLPSQVDLQAAANISPVLSASREMETASILHKRESTITPRGPVRTGCLATESASPPLIPRRVMSSTAARFLSPYGMEINVVTAGFERLQCSARGDSSVVGEK